MKQVFYRLTGKRVPFKDCLTPRDRRPGRERRSFWIAALLAVMVFPASGQAPARGQANRGSGGPLSVVVSRVGSTTIEQERTEPGQHRGVAYYYVYQRESIAIKLGGSLPQWARLHPLIRRQGDDVWVVQQNAIGTAAGEWKAEVQFGKQSDAGETFELQVIVSDELLPPGPITDGMTTANTVAKSPLIRVERRTGRPLIGIAWVAKTPIYGDEEPEVHDLESIQVVARDLPDGYQAGLAIHPVEPWTDHRWVMGEAVGNGHGFIYGHFGEGIGNDNDEYFVFALTAFVAAADKFPPRGQAILPAPWEQYRARFLAESRVVRVVRWEGEFKIKAIGGEPILTRRVIDASRRADVSGAVHRNVRDGERVWIVCIPSDGDPWIAGWTNQLRTSGRWVVKAAQLWTDGHPASFEVLAALSEDDANQKNPAELHKWLHEAELTQVSARVRVPLGPQRKQRALPGQGGRLQ